MDRHVRSNVVLALAASALFAGCEGQQEGATAPVEAATPNQASAAMTGPACTPTGAHVKHGSFACTVCHSVAGSLCFDPSGPAQAPGKPAPAFDFAAKTCSNVACHGVYSGVFEYTMYDPGCECSVPKSAPYGGNDGSTPSWYTTGLGCAACHGNPPFIPGTTARYTWHTAVHGIPMAAALQCSTCHPSASGSNATGGTAFNPTQHANGTVNVLPRWQSGCFNCH